MDQLKKLIAQMYQFPHNEEFFLNLCAQQNQMVSGLITVIVNKKVLLSEEEQKMIDKLIEMERPLLDRFGEIGNNYQLATTETGETQLTLIDLIELLEQYKDSSLRVCFDFDDTQAPYEFCSYRGDYPHLAIIRRAHSFSKQWSYCSYFYNSLVEALGQSFPGYKGGEYTMHSGTPVHIVDDDANVSDIVPVGIQLIGAFLTIKTAKTI